MTNRNLQSVSKPKLRVVDLFAGCGGLTLGFHRAGFGSVAAVEHNRFAAATYGANFSDTHVFCGDIKEWAEGKLPEADVIIGGPPCQGFSNLNRKSKKAPDDRNDLWSAYVDVVAKIQPKIFLLENVDRFFTSAQLESLRDEQMPGGRLENYKIDAAIVRATDFGAAQLRKRTIVIGTRDDISQLRVPKGRVKKIRTVRKALKKVNQKVPTTDIQLPAGRVKQDPDGAMAGPFKTSELHLTRNYEDKSIERFEHIREGGNRFNLPDYLKSPCWIKHKSGAGDVMGRLHWDRPSVTIRTEFFKPEKGRYLHPEENRAITHREAALLQGFPEDFKWYGSKVEIARQIGNAVPVELATALASRIAKHLAKHCPVVEVPEEFTFEKADLGQVSADHLRRAVGRRVGAPRSPRTGSLSAAAL